MVGFYARADASQPIRLDLDNELAGKSDCISGFPFIGLIHIILVLRRKVVYTR